MSSVDQRIHPRYPASLPAAFTLGEVVASESAYLNNISVGGVSFDSMVELVQGTVIMLHFPVSKPVFRTLGRVAWCRKMAFQYCVGAEFIGVDQNFRERMVSLVRKIEEFRGGWCVPVATSPDRTPRSSGSTSTVGNSSAPGNAAICGN